MKILTLIIGLLLIAPLAFAEYTETERCKIEIEADGTIFVAKTTMTYKDGIYVGSILHREPFKPGSDISKENELAKDVAELVWTEEVIEAYEIKKAEREAREIK